MANGQAHTGREVAECPLRTGGALRALRSVDTRTLLQLHERQSLQVGVCPVQSRLHPVPTRWARGASAPTVTRHPSSRKVTAAGAQVTLRCCCRALPATVHAAETRIALSRVHRRTVAEAAGSTSGAVSIAISQAFSCARTAEASRTRYARGLRWGCVVLAIGASEATASSTSRGLNGEATSSTGTSASSTGRQHALTVGAARASTAHFDRACVCGRRWRWGANDELDLEGRRRRNGRRTPVGAVIRLASRGGVDECVVVVATARRPLLTQIASRADSLMRNRRHHRVIRRCLDLRHLLIVIDPRPTASADACEPGGKRRFVVG